MENIQEAAMLVCLVLAIFAGAAIPRAIRLDRRDAELANQENKSEGTKLK